MCDDILSSLVGVRTSHFVYSSLGFFGRIRGGALPGTWFTRALTDLGIEEATIRQTLYRMEKSGDLETLRKGRTKLYAASPATLAVIEAGTDRMLEPGPAGWDGLWTLVYFQFDAEARRARDQVRDILMVEGFASLGPGVYVHPRDRSARIRRAVDELGLGGHLQVFRGTRSGPEEDNRFVRRHWDLAGIAGRYRSFVRRYGGCAGRAPGAWTPRDAFAVRFAMVFEYLEVAWDDPELSADLLPESWPGAEARTLACRLYRALLPGAIAHADHVLAMVGGVPDWPVARSRS